MHTNILKPVERFHLSFPWETNAKGHIIMTPHGYNHSIRAALLGRIFAVIKPEWNCGYQLGIVTADGLKGPDVILATPEYHARHVNVDGYVPEAPEICVEVMSSSNSWQEMMEKMPLYFEVGALEVWIVDVDGKISFFGSSYEQLSESRLIPDAPQSI